MIINTKTGMMILENVFNPIELKIGDESMRVQMRNNAFEIGIIDDSIKSPEGLKYYKWYSVSKKGIIPLYQKAQNNEGNRGVGFQDKKITKMFRRPVALFYFKKLDNKD